MLIPLSGLYAKYEASLKKVEKLSVVFSELEPVESPLGVALSDRATLHPSRLVPGSPQLRLGSENGAHCS